MNKDDDKSAYLNTGFVQNVQKGQTKMNYMSKTIMGVIPMSLPLLRYVTANERQYPAGTLFD